MRRVLHITTVHPRNDTRIFKKELISLSEYYDHADLLVADGKGNSNFNDRIDIYDLGRISNRLLIRIIINPIRALVFILKNQNKYSLFHFHDPELIPVASIISIMGSKTVLDIHESTHESILTKEKIPKILRSLISKIYSVVEQLFVRTTIKNIISATPHIHQRFKQIDNSCIVQNYPSLTDIKFIKKKSKSNNYIYVGNINSRRGIYELIDSFNKSDLDAKLYVVGEFSSKQYKKLCYSIAGNKVEFLGPLDRKELKSILCYCSVGIIPFLPGPNHDNAVPNKLFEYMGWGLNVLASDLPMIRKIILTLKGGELVDFQNTTETIKKLKKIYKQDNIAIGKMLSAEVWRKYNWSKEFENLLKTYNNAK